MYQASQQYLPVMNGRDRGNYSSQLESIVQSYTSAVAYAAAVSPSVEYFSYLPDIISNPLPTLSYHGLRSNFSQLYKNNHLADHFMNPHREYHFEPDHFLKPGKESIFVGKAAEVREHLENAFEKMFSHPFPADIKISICNEKEFRTIAPSPGVIGISFNRKKQSLLSEIFVLNDYLAKVMLTIGHELGHVLTQTLENSHDEEAKAYAFSFVWMKTIKENNIASLQDAIVMENPAQNGLHNVAFSFVQQRQQEKEAWKIYRELIKKEISVSS